MSENIKAKELLERMVSLSQQEQVLIEERKTAQVALENLPEAKAYELAVDKVIKVSEELAEATKEYKSLATDNPSLEMEFIKDKNFKKYIYNELDAIDWAIKENKPKYLLLNTKEYEKLEPAADALGITIKLETEVRRQFQKKAFGEHILDIPADL